MKKSTHELQKLWTKRNLPFKLSDIKCRKNFNMFQDFWTASDFYRK